MRSKVDFSMADRDGVGKGVFCILDTLARLGVAEVGEVNRFFAMRHRALIPLLVGLLSLMRNGSLNTIKT